MKLEKRTYIIITIIIILICSILGIAGGCRTHNVFDYKRGIGYFISSLLFIYTGATLAFIVSSYDTDNTMSIYVSKPGYILLIISILVATIINFFLIANFI